ncbi:Methyltransferase type 11 [Crenothrix polyspora]|uniref:Methyltransferase type 11 n=1 Tax=Crenothrix polyspora TaxID=360316 RepID=A0A1R4HHJ1_9GAMM|nr:methyltransferase domain-containing protein [Crenothrix polyspora]SJM95481.1 Methyltransferase type 11 [Crenothrix polyspora]
MHYLISNQDNRELPLDADLSGKALRKETAEYYDECYWDYLLTWCNRDNLAYHYGYWDKSTPYQHHQALLNKNQVLYDAAGIKASDRVLDAGCGIGGSSIWMAKNYGNRATGMTVSGQQAIYGAQHAKRQGVGDLVDFEVADFCQMPFENESFDVVWALESSCYALNKGVFLKEAMRVLRKGGRVVVCDGFFTRREFNDEEWREVLTCLNGWAVPNLCLKDEFSGLLEQHGFHSPTMRDLTLQTMQSIDYMHSVAKRLRPMQKLGEWLGLRTKGQTANYWVGVAQHYLFTKNLTAYCIFTAQK